LLAAFLYALVSEGRCKLVACIEVASTKGNALPLTDYRVFFVGADGHFEGSRTFLCDTDETAIAWARLEDRSLELWSGARLVKRLLRSDKRDA
jgi:hypothetical protein